MTTILPIGTTVCIACRTPVAIVRRTVEVPCDCGCEGNPFLHDLEDERCIHTHAIPDVAWTVVEASGERHLCPVAA